ncbi:MAG: hypothetical protein ACR2JR_03120 [Rubrobacteraceae bacterium]
MIAASENQPNAAPAFAGRERLCTGVSDAHRHGRRGGAIRLMDELAVLSRSR